MISNFFSRASALDRIRFGAVAPFIDGFTRSLVDAGFSRSTILQYLRAAALSLAKTRSWRLNHEMLDRRRRSLA
jgi:hypothetical protein